MAKRGRGPDPSGFADRNSGPRGSYTGPSRHEDSGEGSRGNRRGSFGAVAQRALERIEQARRQSNSRRDRAISTQHAGRPGGGARGEALLAASQLDDLRRQFLEQFSTDLPGPALAPLPSLADYVKPFDDARNQANRVYGETVPVLNNIYNDLDSNMGRGQQQAAAEAASARQAAAREQAAMMQQAEALTAPTTLDQALGVAGPNSDASRQAEADQAFLALRGADQAQLARTMEQNDASAGAQRQQDAGAMREGSLATAKTNLDQLLSAIGLGRAQAQRQHAADSAEVSRSNANAQTEYATLKSQVQREQLDQAAQAEQMWADQNEKIAAASATSRRAGWEQAVNSRMERNPAATDAMLTIIKEAGEGPEGRAAALAILRDETPVLTNRDENAYGKKLNVDVIGQWLDEYYDDTETVDPRAYAQLGGDPLYLPVRQRYQLSGGGRG